MRRKQGQPALRRARLRQIAGPSADRGTRPEKRLTLWRCTLGGALPMFEPTQSCPACGKLHDDPEEVHVDAAQVLAAWEKAIELLLAKRSEPPLVVRRARAMQRRVR